VPRVARSTLPDGLFHVIARGVYDTRIYRDEADRRWFLKLLRRSEHTHGWTCHAFCLMTTRYHLVLETTRLELSRGLHQLNGRYARGFNGRYSRYGHLFAERYFARSIEDEQYLYEACSYVLLNPVRARLCDRVEEWPWSYSRFEFEAT